MELLRVLIVDDEKIFVDHLEKAINWAEYGCILCGKAYDGTEALIKIKETQPHIIFMDIQMSKMDGLQVCELIDREDSLFRIIIISAYEAFNFAKRAIKLGVFDYLTKPFDEEELIKTLTSCIEDIEEEYSTRQFKLNAVSNDRENKIRAVLSFGETLDVSQLLEIKNISHMLVSLIKISDQRNNKFYEHIKIALASFIDYDGVIQSIIGGEQNHNFVVVHFYNKGDKGQRIIKERFSLLLEKTLDISVECVALGSSVDRAALLGKSYQKAIIAMENRVKIKKNVISIDDLQHLQGRISLFTQEDVHFLIHLFEMKNYGELDSHIERLFQLSDDQMINLDYMVSSYMSIVRYVLIYYKDKNLNSLEYNEILDQIKTELHLCSTSEEISRTIINGIYDLLSEYADLDAPSQNNHLVNRIESFLTENFRKNGLTVKDIEDALFFENSYIRRVYKSHKGKTIMQRLEELKLIESKRLIRESDKPIAEIAESVGYTSQYYFSRRFKLDNKITPTEYRLRYKTNDL